MFLRANSLFTHFAIISLFCTSIFFHSDISGLLQANSIAMLKHEPIKNMVYPYSKTVDWSKSLSSTSLAFSQIDPSLLIEPIKYIPSQLGSVKDLDTLDSQILNARLTYSVPYLGNYKYDGKEYVGSHPGVDIKLPKGTPIVSIANGIVTKAKHSEIGFGNHVVIRHNNVYNPELNAYEDIFSSYAHLSQIHVQAGDIVKVGQIIGESGSTGLSTGSHLNFQIEKDSAPYHPYWPFSDREIYAAGFNFVSGVNKAYGFENALEHTYNPLIYIDSAFIDTYIASESIKTEPKLTEEIKTEKLSLDKVTEYLTASVIRIEKSPEIELPNKEIVKSQYQVASVVFDNQTGFVWNIPPLIKPAKSYEFIISDDSLNLEDLSFKSNKSVQIEFIEKVDSDLFFSFQTNAIGSIEIQLLNKNNVIDSKSIDSLMVAGNNISESDIDYEKIKLLSIMGFLSNTQLDLDSKISLYESIKQITKYLNFKGFETQNPQTDVVFYESEKYDNKLLSQAFSFGLISESDLISLDKNIDMGEFFKRYYKSTDSYVSALPKWPFKSFIRSFGANKLYVQQALIDNLITEDQLRSSYLTTRDLINITYNVIVKK